MNVPAVATEAQASTMFHILGHPVVTVAGRAVRLGGPRQVAVLVRLLLSPAQVVSMDQLTASVWGEDCPARPEVAIRSYVSNLRRAIEPDRDPGDRDRRSCIESQPPGYRLAVEPEQIDAHRFEVLVADGRRSLAAADPAAAVSQLGAAARLWRGEPSEGVAETDALLGFRARLCELRLALVELLFEARLGLGEHESVVCELETAINDHPLRERLTELGMLALYRAGRQSEALARYRGLRARLVDELGVDPSPAVQELERKILTHDPSLAPVPLARPALQPRSSPPPRPPSSSRLSLAPTSYLAGRQHELQVLAGMADCLTSKTAASALITGEPGSGKTALASALSQMLTQAQVQVVWGRCRAAAAQEPLWPWRQVLDEFDEFDALHGPEGSPCHWYRPVVDMLRRHAARQGLVVVLEDVHWADDASLDLLSFAGESLAAEPVGFITTWRHTEVGYTSRNGLRSLARLPAARWVELAGLDLDAVERLCATNGNASRQFAHKVWTLTAGNPLLVTELLAGLANESSAGPVVLPAGVRDAVLDRVERCHRLGVSVLTVASLLQRRFTPEVVADVLGLAAGIVDEALGSAARAGLLVEDSAQPRSYRFTHPISASVLAAELPGPRRARLHAAIGQALQRQRWPSGDLAYHFARSGSPRTSVLAARFALDAATSSGDVTTAEVEQTLEQGLLALKTLDNQASLQAEIATFLARCALCRGDQARYESLTEQAIGSAMRSGDGGDDGESDALATTALAAVSPAWTGIEPRPERAAARLVSCLDHLGRDYPLRPALELTECRFRAMTGADWSKVRRDAVAAAEASEEVGPSPRLAALVALGYLLLGRGGSDERLSLADELARLISGPASDPGKRLLAARLQIIGTLDGGSPAAVAKTLVAAVADVEPIMTPTAQLDLASVRVMVDLHFGRLESAAAILRDATARCRVLGCTTAGPLDTQLLILRWFQGDHSALARQVAEGGTDRVTSLVTAALATALSGAIDESRGLLDELLSWPSWPGVVTNRPGLDLVAMIAVAANRSDHRAVAKAALKPLLADRGALVVTPRGEAVLGPVSYFAGLAAATTGKAKLARALLGEARQQAEAIGAQAVLAWINQDPMDLQ